ncbi:uncharacterized protein FIBRA_06321 [Fibroporia radiculosa]|uniref:Oxidation resistance protein 1 n=1 Tax=Fibroporia radiculosa TaxID=599839 RepID=J4H406_9APHY|nr:uncharacterized protein FIBRA_06321 [Fibroporia radiculosa]CCM04159.1 predicted protein [Fibroporia radiculosa]
MSPTLPAPLIPLPEGSQGAAENGQDDLYATLFSPPTPRASPEPESNPIDMAKSSRARRHTRTPSSDSEFGSFISVPFSEDPLQPSTSNLDMTPLSPIQNINFFDRFTEDAQVATERNKRGLLDELLKHEDDPMYFLQLERENVSGTATPIPISPREAQPAVGNAQVDPPLGLDTSTTKSASPVRQPRQLSRQRSRFEVDRSRSISPPLRSPSLPPSSPARISKPEIQRSQSSFFTPTSLPSRWMTSLLSSAVRSSPPRQRATTDESKRSDEPTIVHTATLPSVLPSQLMDSLSNLARPSGAIATHPLLSTAVDDAITHGTPFAAHPFVPATGAPGFAGDRDWNKGFEFDKSKVERRSVRLVGRKEVTTPVLNAELADALRPHFPALSRLPRSWSLLYSLDQHGISLNTLYTRCQSHMGGALVVMRDSSEAIFGAWMGEGIRPSKGSYYGSGESFLWKLIPGKSDKQLRVFKWTGKNDYVALCEPEYISFGGGDGHYGLYLDDSLIDGSSAWCPTYDNEPLCSSGPRQGENLPFIDARPLVPHNFAFVSERHVSRLSWVAHSKDSEYPSKDPDFSPVDPLLMNTADATADGASEEVSNSQTPGGQSFTSLPISAELWRPVILRIWPSVLFVALLLVLIALLETFIRLSVERHGFEPPSLTSQYVLTYAPVALLIVIGWIWQMYEISVKTLVPWAKMRGNFVQARHSLLLDYIGENIITGSIKAILNRDYTILCCIVGSLTIAAATIVSTYMWSVIPTTYSTSVSLTQPYTYYGARLDSTADVAQSLGSYLTRRALNLAEPAWMTTDYVIDAFNITTPEPDMVISAATKGYNTSLACDTAVTTLLNNGTEIQVNYGGVTNTYACDIFPDQPDNYTFIPETTFVYAAKVYNWTVNTTTPAMLLATKLYAVGNCVEATAVACLPRYSEIDLSVSVDAQTGAFNASPRAIGQSSTTSFRGGSYLLQTIDNNNGVTGSPWDEQGATNVDNNDPFSYIPWVNTAPNVTEIGSYSPWFHLLRDMLLLSPDDIMNADMLASGSKQIFADIAPSVIQQSSVANNEDIEGSMLITELRLVARSSSVHIIQACFALLVIMVVCIVFWRPLVNVPRNPSSLGAMALFLSQSPALERKLQNMGSLSWFDMALCLHDAHCQTIIDENGNFRVCIKDGDDGSETENKQNVARGPPSGKKMASWVPPILHSAGQLGLAVILVVLIAVLELLYQLSNKRNGLAEFYSNHISEYAWSYSAPAVLFLAGLAVDMFDLGVRTIHPYVLLHKDLRPGGRALTYDPMHHTIFTIGHHAINHRQPVIVMSTLMVVLIPILKVVVAGLFMTGTVSYTASVSVALDTTFQFNDSILANETAVFLNPDIPSYSSGQASYEVPALDLIVGLGLQTPVWTTSDIAIGSVKNSSLDSLPANANITVKLPVLHSDLVNCTTPNYTANVTDGVVWPSLPCLDTLVLDGNFSFVVLNATSNAGAAFPVPGQSNCTSIFFVYTNTTDANLIVCNYTMTQ